MMVLTNHRSLFNSFVLFILSAWGFHNPFSLLVSLLIQPLMGIECLSHYQQQCPELKQYYGDRLPLCQAGKLRAFLQRISNSMLAWKLFLLQSQLIRQRCPQLLESGKQVIGRVLDIDVSTVISFASKREGAAPGFNRKYKGKPCFQLSASFIGKVFVDGRLFAGWCNPKNFFQRAVKRAIALGYGISIVRADSAYLTIANVLFLFNHSLGFAIGAPGSFNVVKEGKALFKKLARRKHFSIIPLAKGVSGLDLGLVSLASGLEIRLMIIRRITRRKNRKTGKWVIKTYYYAIATNLDLSPRKLYAFYHDRQRIENGFRELKHHYSLKRLPVANFKGNEFWIVCKMFAMMLVKLFQHEMLPKALQALRRKTLIRRVFAWGFFVDRFQEVQIRLKRKYTWLLQRLFSKLERMKAALSP
jgi:hypothetical protein